MKKESRSRKQLGNLKVAMWNVKRLITFAPRRTNSTRDFISLELCKVKFYSTRLLRFSKSSLKFHRHIRYRMNKEGPERKMEICVSCNLSGRLGSGVEEGF